MAVDDYACDLRLVWHVIYVVRAASLGMTSPCLSSYICSASRLWKRINILFLTNSGGRDSFWRTVCLILQTKATFESRSKRWKLGTWGFKEFLGN